MWNDRRRASRVTASKATRRALVGLAVFMLGWAPASAAPVANARPAASPEQKAPNPKKLLKEADKLSEKKKYAEALVLYRQAAAAFNVAKEAKDKVDALSSAGALLRKHLNDAEGALASYAEALDVARTTADQKLVARTLEGVAITSKTLGRRHEALAAYQEELAIFESLKAYEEVVATLTSLVDTYKTFGDERSAAAHRARAADVESKHNIPFPLARSSAFDEARKAKNRPMPAIPPGQRGRTGYKTVVTVAVIVAPDGRVERARALEGDALFFGVSVEAALKVRFEPLPANAEQVRTLLTINVSFTFA